jgi:hypothetical protein
VNPGKGFRSNPELKESSGQVWLRDGIDLAKGMNDQGLKDRQFVCTSVHVCQCRSEANLFQCQLQTVGAGLWQ